MHQKIPTLRGTQRACLRLLVSGMSAMLPLAAGGDPLRVEEVGQPVLLRDLSIEAVTEKGGRTLAWGVVGGDPIGLAAIDTKTGKSEYVDLSPYGKAFRVLVHKGKDGNLYIFAGQPGRFLKFDPAAWKLTEIARPLDPNARYWLGQTAGPDGTFYVGIMPNALLFSLNPDTGEARNHGTMASDPRQQYVIHPVAGDDNIIYCPVGLHHSELVAYNPATGKKKQILENPEDGNSVRLSKGEDGRVYGTIGDRTFLCKPDGIEFMDLPPMASQPRPMAGDKIAQKVDAQGRLVLLDPKTQEQTFIQTDFRGKHALIFVLSTSENGKLYGSSISPANVFTYDEASRKFTNHGLLTTGPVQIYDMLKNPAGSGLFLTSYTKCGIDWWDPEEPKGEKNPRKLADLTITDSQERPFKAVLGPDGAIYIASSPVKGHLGGALTRLRPETEEITVWRNVIPNQSVYSLAPVARTKSILCGSWIVGGSSSIPTEKEACLFEWDTAKEAVSHKAQPVPGAVLYGSMAMAPGGVVYGHASTAKEDKQYYYAYDPVRRKTLHVAELPVSKMRHPGLFPRSMGPQNLIYGIGDDTLFAIDPKDHSVEVVKRDESLRDGFGLFVTDAGTLYYGSGSKLMRMDLGWKKPDPRAHASSGSVQAEKKGN